MKQCISELKAENDKIKARNVELKARIVELEDKQTQNELIKNLLSAGSHRAEPLRSSGDYRSRDQSLANPLPDVTQFVI